MIKKHLYLCFGISLLTACDSMEDSIKEHLICALAAKEMGDYKSFELAQSKLKKFQDYKSFRDQTAYAMEIVDEAKNELGIYEPGGGKLFKIAKAYYSSDCQRLYEN